MASAAASAVPPVNTTSTPPPPSIKLTDLVTAYTPSEHDHHTVVAEVLQFELIMEMTVVITTSSTTMTMRGIL
eukprot:1346061-Ditylum_brightwellii.AAC.1